MHAPQLSSVNHGISQGELSKALVIIIVTILYITLQTHFSGLAAFHNDLHWQNQQLCLLMNVWNLHKAAKKLASFYMKKIEG